MLKNRGKSFGNCLSVIWVSRGSEEGNLSIRNYICEVKEVKEMFSFVLGRGRSGELKFRE